MLERSRPLNGVGRPVPHLGGTGHHLDDSLVPRGLALEDTGLTPVTVPTWKSLWHPVRRIAYFTPNACNHLKQVEDPVASEFARVVFEIQIGKSRGTVSLIAGGAHQGL